MMRLEDRYAPWTGDGSDLDGTGDAVQDVAHRLTAMIVELSTHRPDPSDGPGWLNFDAALSDLHGALVALEEFGRGADGTPEPGPVLRDATPGVGQ